MTRFLVITPVINGEKYLLDNCEQMLRAKRQAPDSAVTWLIRDGASTDQTLSLLRQWISHHGIHSLREVERLDIHVFSEGDMGMYDALNQGLIYARDQRIDYDIFFWLNVDDRLADNSLRSMAMAYDASDGDGWFISRGIDIDCEGSVITNQPHERLDLDRLRSGEFNYASASWVKAESCFFSRRIFRRLGSFNGQLRLAGDYDLILRAANLMPPTYVDGCQSREFRRWSGQQSSALIEYEIERKKVQAAHLPSASPALIKSMHLPVISQTIFFYPDYTSGNGYQEELYRGINAYGFSVIEHLITADPVLGEGEIFHLHWLNDIVGRCYDDANRLWQWLRGFILRSKGRGAMVIWTVHNISSHENKNIDLEEEIIAFLVQECDRCHMHDQLVVYAFEKRYGILPWGRLRIAEHGAYPKVDAERSARVLCEFGLLSTDPYVVIPGQLRYYKNLDLLKAGLTFIDHQFPGMAVCLLGQFHSELSADDVKQIRETPNARWLSYRLSDEQYSAFVREAAFALMTYVNISTSGAVIHCLSQSCRVVAPRLGSIPSLVRSGDQGFLYVNDDRQSFFSAIKSAEQASKSETNSELVSATVAHLNWSSILPRILTP
jgi:glycosyltransferase involved in cell wall biosynthesis